MNRRAFLAKLACATMFLPVLGPATTIAKVSVPVRNAEPFYLGRIKMYAGGGTEWLIRHEAPEGTKEMLVDFVWG